MYLEMVGYKTDEIRAGDSNHGIVSVCDGLGTRHIQLHLGLMVVNPESVFFAIESKERTIQEITILIGNIYADEVRAATYITMEDAYFELRRALLHTIYLYIAH